MDVSANTIASEAQRGAGQTRYRPDIDGLRSIAVLGVVLYHFHVPGFSGGYVGVDIFYVISGFLIGRSIISDMRAGTYSLIGFYERRIRRLYPAFVVVAAVSAIGFYFMLLPLELKGFGRSLVAAVFYVSNIAFYKDRGYFDASSIDKPLLHTWSLSVEEQFYVVFPVAVYLTVRWRASTLPFAFALVGVASFGAAEWMLRANADAVFYLFPYRAWELLVGVGLTIITDRELPGWFNRGREPIAVAALALIIGPICFYTHNTPFPALAALPPCLGSAMIILAGSRGSSIATRLLATRVPVFIGLVSYSYYLWHWPILVALNYYFGAITPLLTATGISVSFALAVISWRFIERPPRRKGFLGRKALFAWAAILSLLLAGTGFLFYRTNGIPKRFSGTDAPLIYAEQDFIQTGGTCFDSGNETYPGLEYCRIGSQTGPVSFLAWGDSHGRAYRDGIDQLGRELGKAGILVWAAGCPPLFSTGKREVFDSGTEDPACRKQNELVGDLITRTPTLRSAILIGRWAYYTQGTGIGRDLKNRVTLLGPDSRKVDTIAAQQRLFEDLFEDTVRRLASRGMKVFVLEQTPEFPQSASNIIARGVINGRLSREDVKWMTQVARADVERRQAVAQALFARLSGAGKLTVLRTHDMFCSRSMCDGWFAGAPVLFDNNHVTITTSRRLRKIFTPAL